MHLFIFTVWQQKTTCITVLSLWQDILCFCTAPAFLYKEWLCVLSAEVCKVTNTQTPSQIFVQYSQETHNPKVLHKGSCGSNKYPWSSSRPHRSLFWGGERLSFLLLNTTHQSGLEMPVISQPGTMCCVQAVAACTINDNHTLKHALSLFAII